MADSNQEAQEAKDAPLRIIAWVFGVLLLCGTFGAFFEGTWLTGFVMLGLAVVIIPNTWQFINRVVGRSISRTIRIGIALALLFSFVMLEENRQSEREITEVTLDAQQDSIRGETLEKEFYANRHSILQQVTYHLDAGEFAEALQITLELQEVGDSYIDSLHEVALEGMKVQGQRRALEEKWTYNTSIDEMTSATTRTASIQSQNTVNFSFPYSGAQRAQLTLRNHPSYGRDVIFQIQRGQLLCRTYSRCRVRVRFDEGQPQSWSANPPADHSSTSLFLQSYNRFLQRMRQSKVVRIQPEVYEEGNPVFKFHVEGFDDSRYAGN